MDAKGGKNQIRRKDHACLAWYVNTRVMLIYQRSQRLRGKHSLMAAFRSEWKAFHVNYI